MNAVMHRQPPSSSTKSGRQSSRKVLCRALREQGLDPSEGALLASTRFGNLVLVATLGVGILQG